MKFHNSTHFRLWFACVLSLALGQAGWAEDADHHVILISCDGLRPDAVEKLGQEKVPNLFRLMQEGASTGNARTDKTHTVTLPNHTAMLTGRPVAGAAGHNWTSNGTPKLGESLHTNKKQYVGSMFDIGHDHGLRTGLYASKVKFILYSRSYDERNGRPDAIGEDNRRDKIDVYVFEKDIEKLMDQFIAAMKADPYELSMLHLRDTDTSGHASGWDLTDGSPYMQAVVRIDGVLGKLLGLLDSDERLKGKTSIIITADHGGRMETKTHLKADSPFNFTIPFMVWGPAVKAGADLYALNATNRKDPGKENPPFDAEAPAPIRNGDAGNLALSLLGLPPIDGSSINPEHDLKVSD